MHNIGSLLVKGMIVVVGALIGSLLMLLFTGDDGWAGFAGWVIFFVAIQTPAFIGRQDSLQSCTAWFRRRGARN